MYIVSKETGEVVAEGIDDKYMSCQSRLSAYTCCEGDSAVLPPDSNKLVMVDSFGRGWVADKLFAERTSFVEFTRNEISDLFLPTHHIVIRGERL